MAKKKIVLGASDEDADWPKTARAKQEEEKALAEAAKIHQKAVEEAAKKDSNT